MANGKLYEERYGRATTAFDVATNKWSNVASMIYGKSLAGSRGAAVGLAGALTVGGGQRTRTAEILDTSVATPKWSCTER